MPTAFFWTFSSTYLSPSVQGAQAGVLNSRWGLTYFIYNLTKTYLSLLAASCQLARLRSSPRPCPWCHGHAPSSAASLWVLYQMLWQNPKISGPSAALVAFSRNSNRFVAQDFPCLNPRWLALINLFRSRCAVMASHITDSITLQGTEIIRWSACAL